MQIRKIIVLTYVFIIPLAKALNMPEVYNLQVNSQLKSDNTTFKIITGGLLHTCGLTDLGIAYCWGSNLYGQLGNNYETYVTAPTRVDQSSSGIFTSIVAGGLHTCGLTPGGDIYCWGYNVFGQLGNGEEGTISNPSPTKVSGPLIFKKIYAGGQHTCGITTNGKSYCWGYNRYGQLGDGTITNKSSPEPISSNLNFTDLATGYYHTCGITSGKFTYCWGDNSFGEVGSGKFSDLESRPKQVNTNLSTNAVFFTGIYAGGNHSCETDTMNNLYCWGENEYGQLGNGTYSDKVTPSLVIGNIKFKYVTLGYDGSCGADNYGAFYCWGYGAQGQLGNDTRQYATQPTEIKQPSMDNFIVIYSGAFQNCAISELGDSYCWGFNENGQLGTGDTKDKLLPTKVLEGESSLHASVKY